MSDEQGKQQHHWKPCRKLPVLVHYRRAEPGETVETREGVMTARPGDLMIRGVAGEVYPIGPDIFEATYERTDPLDDAMSGGPVEALERRIEERRHDLEGLLTPSEAELLRAAEEVGPEATVAAVAALASTNRSQEAWKLISQILAPWGSGGAVRACGREPWIIVAALAVRQLSAPDWWSFLARQLGRAVAIVEAASPTEGAETFRAFRAAQRDASEVAGFERDARKDDGS